MSDRTLKVRILGDAGNFAKAVDTTERRLGSLGDSLRRIGMVPGLVALASQASSLTSAVAPAIGVIGAIPAVASMAAASISTLAVGLQGIGAAFQTAGASAGGAAADTTGMQRAVEAARRGVVQAERDVVAAMRQVEDANYDVREATDDVADAQERAVEAQQKLAEAYDEARRSLAEYATDLTEASLSQESADIARIEAQERLARVMADGTSSELDKRKAILDANQADLSYQESIKRRTELEREVQVAQKAGLEGDERVISARRGVADANESVENANRKLFEAQRGLADANQGVVDAQEKVVLANQQVADSLSALEKAQGSGTAATNKAAEAFAKLAPNAQRFVRAVQGLAGEWNALTRSVQNRLFEDLDRQVVRVASSTLPTLRVGMVDVAGAFNRFTIATSNAVSSPIFQGSLAKIFAETSKSIDAFTPGIVSLTTGLFHLSAVTAPLVTKFFEWAGARLELAGMFLTSEEGANRVSEAVERGAAVLASLGRIGINVGITLKNIFAEANAEGFLATIETLTRRMREWSESIEGQEKSAEVFDALSEVASHFAEVLPVLADVLGDVFGALNSIPEPMKAAILQFAAWSLVLGPVIKGAAAVSVGVKGISSAVKTTSGLIGGFVKTLIKFEDKLVKLVPVLGRAPVALAGFAGPVGIAIAVLAGLAAGVIWAYKNIEPFRNAVQVAGKAIGEFWDRLKIGDGEGAAQALIVPLQSGLDWVVETGLPLLKEKLASWAVAFTEWVEPRIPILLSMLGKLALAVLSFVTEAAPVLLEQLAIWGGQFVSWVAPRIPELLGELAKLWFRVFSWFWFEVIPGAAVALWQLGWEFVKWVAPRIPELLVELTKLLFRLVAWVAFEAVPQTVLAVAGLGVAFLSWLGPTIRDMLGGLAQLGGQIIGWAVSLPGTILNAIGNLGTLLIQKGIDLVAGLIFGIQSMGPALLNAVATVITGNVPLFIQNKWIMKSPSRLAMGLGANFGAGLAIGLRNQKQNVQEATDAILPNLDQRDVDLLTRTMTSSAGSSETADRLATAALSHLRSEPSSYSTHYTFESITIVTQDPEDFFAQLKAMMKRDADDELRKAPPLPAI